MPVRLGAAAQQTLRLGAAPVSKMYLGASLVYGASTPPPQTNDAPYNVTGIAGDASVTLSWTIATTKPALTHTVQQSGDDGVTWTTSVATILTASTAIISGLTNGTRYRFRVASVTASGPTAYSASSNLIQPLGTPGVPTNARAVLESGQLVIYWDAPATTGGATLDELSYVVQFGVNGSSITWQTMGSPVSSRLFTPASGLVCGSVYRFRVAAQSALAISSYSTQSATYTAPTSAPGAVRNLSATPLGGGASLAWVAPLATGCAAPSAYRIWHNTNPTAAKTLWGDVDASLTSASVSGLTNGTAYYLYVAGVNTAGAGPIVQVGPITPAGSGLAAPAELEAFGTANGGSIWLYWLPVPSATQYVLNYSADGGVTWSPDHVLPAQAPLAIPGYSHEYYRYAYLPGNTYRVRVKARGIVGAEGPYAYVTSTRVTDYDPVVVARITHGSTATRLEYYPAASPSGAPATNYVVQYRTATVNANGTYSATGSWITVDKDDHTTTYYTITGLQAAQAYLFRVAAEGSAGIGPFHYPRGAVTVNSLAAMPNNVTSPSGAFLVNAPAGWSQPTNNDPYAAGRWFSFTRPGIITFTVTTGVTDAMVIAYNTSGEQLGIVTQSSGTSQSHRLCFFASPGTRYVVHHGGVELTVQSLVVAGGVMRVVDYTVGSTPDATPFFLSPAWPANSRSQNTLHLALGALTGVAGNSDDVWIQATAQGYLTIAIASTGTTPNHMVWRGTASVPRDQLVGFDDKAAVYVIQNVGVGDRITISGQTGSQPSNMSISVRFSPEPCVNLPPVNNWP